MGAKLYLAIFLGCLASQCGYSSNCFRAGVYEHIRIGADVPNPGTADVSDVDFLRQNLDVYSDVARRASKEGVQLLVFPEDGLFVPADRQDAKNYVEHVPVVDPNNLVNPCDSDEYHQKPGILWRLSCMAKNGSLYVVADMADIQPCSNATSNNTCPSDGVLMYNTLVAFDPQGNVVAKYHKHHLFGEDQYDWPAQEYVTFDTPFGRMGMFICFDKIFRNPGIQLVENMGVDTMLLSTWWFDEMPHFLAPQYHQGWAYTNNVNMLVANIKKAGIGSTGSGFYSGRRGALHYHHASDVGGFAKLLVSNVPVSARQDAQCTTDAKTISFDYQMDNSSYAFTTVPLDDLVAVKLTKRRGDVQVCTDGFCCALNYSMSALGNSSNQAYYLGVTNRIRTSYLGSNYKWCEESCTLVSYDESVGNYSRSSHGATFEYIHLGASFSTKYVYPSVMTDNYKLAKTSDWGLTALNGNAFELSVTSEESVLTAALYGRCYQRDPPYKPWDFRPASH